MKKFLMKVNGNQYEVEVEEIRDGVLPVPSAVSTAQPVQAASAAPVQTQSAPPAAVTENKAVSNGPVGTTKITAPMPGTILKIVANAGDSVKRGQVLLILEAMKMENELVAPSDGTVASINVSKGASVNAGDLLASLN